MGLAGGVGTEASGFLTSLAPGVTAAPKGFENSCLGLDGGDFGADTGAGLELTVDEFELEENLELKLVIQEFLLPGGPCFGSLGFFVGLELCASGFSELAR